MKSSKHEYHVYILRHLEYLEGKPDRSRYWRMLKEMVETIKRDNNDAKA